MTLYYILYYLGIKLQKTNTAMSASVSKSVAERDGTF